MNPDDNADFTKQGDSEESLEVLRKNLYSRQNIYSGPEDVRGKFKPHEVNVQTNWASDGAESPKRVFQDPQKRMSFLKKIFIISVIFFVASVGLAFYVFFGGGNVISSNNVTISIIGPVAVSGGEIVPLEISVTNQNNADLETSDLIIDYPEGTREAVNQSIPLKRFREAFGTIRKGETAVKKIQAVLFGEAGETKAINISVEYRLKGSNATFSKMKEYEVAISSAPVTISITSVNEINANQETEFSVAVVSNSSSIIQKLALAAEYPFGFTFTGSDPKPSWSNSYWQLGDVKPGSKRLIKIRGKIAGQDNEDRAFRFSVGTESVSNENVIGTNFLTSTKKITIRKPFIGTSLALDGDTVDIHIARAGKIIRADLTLTNNVGLKITDVKASVKLSGNIFDSGSVSVSSGFYRSFEQTILWDQTLKSGLAVLNPDDSVNLSFSLGSLPETAIRLIQNPEMNIAVIVRGKRFDESGVSQEVTSTISKSIRVASVLGLATRAIYYSGPFTNTGPLPPKADTATSYTIVWSLTNGSTDLSNVKVTATLPSYMTWLNVTVPQDEKITYNPIGGQILWDAGNLSAGTGFNNSPRQVSFQVSIVPSVGQSGTAPILVTEASASGDDSFARQTVQATARVALTTNLTTDISFQPGQGNVVK